MLARIASDRGDWERAVALRLKAAEALGGEMASELCCQAGDIYAHRLADDVRADQTYQQALGFSASSRRALLALAQMHRRYQRRDQLIWTLQNLVKLESDAGEQVTAYVEIVQLAEKDVDDVGRQRLAMDSIRAALSLDPANLVALAGLERRCRRDNRWDELAAALERAPRSPRSLELLAECYEHLQRWRDLAQLREQQLAQLPTSEAHTIARLARALAHVYEERLDDLEAAARAWHRVDESDAAAVEAARALQRIYEARGRHADLAAACERELSRQPEPARALELWLRLGDLHARKLARPREAAAAYEQAILLDPSQDEALAALVEIYRRTGKGSDLQRILDLRARAVGDPQQRAAVLVEKGLLLERAGDDEGALATYLQALELDAANRKLFTSLERVSYRRERWPLAMQLYDRAIRIVEEGQSRAYRLADLYLRKGQLLLQFLRREEEAIACYLRVIDLDAEADTAQTALEEIYAARGEWSELIRVYERRAALVRDDAKRVDVLRRAARLAGDRLADEARAAELYSRILATDPTDGEGLEALERHFERHRQWAKLVEILRTRIMLTAGGDEAIALYQRIASLCEEGLHDLDQAIGAMEKILQIAPANPKALETLARLCEATERWSDFVDVTNRQIRIVGDRAQKSLLYFKCGSVVEAKFGHDEEAVRYYESAIRTSQTCLPAVHGLRDLYLRREDWPHVIESLQLEANMWSEAKERAGVLANIGQIYGDKLGDEERAVRHFEAALKVDAECLPANRALFEITFARGDHARAAELSKVLMHRGAREGDPTTRSELQRKRAMVALANDDARGGAEALLASLESDPENLEALNLLLLLVREHPAALDLTNALHELERVYRRDDQRRGLARVLVAQGSLREQACDVDGAEQLYLEGARLDGSDYLIVEAQVALYQRLCCFGAAAAVLERFIEQADATGRSRARLRLAEISGDYALEPARAVAVLEALIAEQPTHCEAHFRLAQELCVLGRFAEALAAGERLVRLAAAPDAATPSGQMARYYGYLGRAAEAAGELATAQRAYLRALELNADFAPSTLALARIAWSAGEKAKAEEMLAQISARTRSKDAAAVPALERGIMRLWVYLGEPMRATVLLPGAYEGASADDRVWLASLRASTAGGWSAAAAELLAVFDGHPHAAIALVTLADVYRQAGEDCRVARVTSTMRLLGIDPSPAPCPVVDVGRRAKLEGEQRRVLLPAGIDGVFLELLHELHDPLATLFPPPKLGPVVSVVEPRLRAWVGDVEQLLGVSVEVGLARGVPRGAMALAQPHPTLIVDELLAQRPEGECRFLIGRALEPLRGGYTLPLRLVGAAHTELGKLLDQLLRQKGERSAEIQEIIDHLPRREVRALEKLQLMRAGDPTSVGEWLDWLETACDRVGLLACGDIAPAARMLAFLGGDELAITPQGAVLLGQIPRGLALARFFLSNAYDEIERSTRLAT